MTNRLLKKVEESLGSLLFYGLGLGLSVTLMSMDNIIFGVVLFMAYGFCIIGRLSR